MTVPLIKEPSITLDERKTAKFDTSSMTSTEFYPLTSNLSSFAILCLASAISTCIVSYPSVNSVNGSVFTAEIAWLDARIAVYLGSENYFRIELQTMSHLLSRGNSFHFEFLTVSKAVSMTELSD